MGTAASVVVEQIDAPYKTVTYSKSHNSVAVIYKSGQIIANDKAPGSKSVTHAHDTLLIVRKQATIEVSGIFRMEHSGLLNMAKKSKIVIGNNGRLVIRGQLLMEPNSILTIDEGVECTIRGGVHIYERVGLHIQKDQYVMGDWVVPSSMLCQQLFGNGHFRHRFTWNERDKHFLIRLICHFNRAMKFPDPNLVRQILYPVLASHICPMYGVLMPARQYTKPGFCEYSTEKTFRD